MPKTKLLEFLERNKINYKTITHPKEYTSQKIAAAAHIPGKEVAKTVIIKIDGRMAMAVLPASFKVDFEMLKDAIQADNIEMAMEHEFKDIFPDCEIGAMPPFGNLYGMDVYVAESLIDDEQIAFNACSHTEMIVLSTKDYGKLVKPKVLKFSYQPY